VEWLSGLERRDQANLLFYQQAVVILMIMGNVVCPPGKYRYCTYITESNKMLK
jgi:hypothetical protein